ncbi:MAG: hypothetical protein A2655_00460 [Candidatus Yanofskybacteria bacterium RIFCSPHIGHO2_01_FULL_43_42]|uniref:Uncharacterized protein n=1 Tax=Candidatus Yanofskybacteria bacterium RIFCSPLOWO2_01_FULL_43_22 TaxID=1802695 RepID=A0A1F8GFT6_9BACT|nr:MAG: hypothetical protein A2655_00460 [Candidatus Yanofskybacteria bacterium RIFCSPHIGHO2_01_FULL_43_42]OGN13730.1 MAG: hypothetical protein A3D48_00215 [Candidatus Yanofskybacteria bacterium RIFCSPHIGHO2_02_FULL_43_17]OGN24247.1 MAG: hypothetical protein A3A13_03655 [Candidatus Yanofskybacteria bacterium RIFCSPLOWO2_01_FULL_43_22]
MNGELRQRIINLRNEFSRTYENDATDLVLSDDEIQTITSVVTNKIAERGEKKIVDVISDFIKTEFSKYAEIYNRDKKIWWVSFTDNLEDTIASLYREPINEELAN